MSEMNGCLIYMIIYLLMSVMIESEVLFVTIPSNLFEGEIYKV